MFRSQALTLGRWTLHFVNAICAFQLLKENFGSFVFMSGPSMLPTMSNNGEIAFELTATWLRSRPLARGDLVTLRSPLDPSRLICKRVLGLPGDIVCVDPTGLKAPPMEYTFIPRGHVWLIGENASAATDSRDYGPVSEALIRGKLIARVWPWHRAGIFRNPFSLLE